MPGNQQVPKAPDVTAFPLQVVKLARVGGEFVGKSAKGAGTAAFARARRRRSALLFWPTARLVNDLPVLPHRNSESQTCAGAPLRTMVDLLALALGQTVESGRSVQQRLQARFKRSVERAAIPALPDGLD